MMNDDSECSLPYEDQDSFGLVVVHTKIATIPEDIESFQALKDYVDSVLEGQVSRCQLIYEPSECKLYCYLFLSFKGSRIESQYLMDQAR